MKSLPFEAPKKVDLKERVSAALDASGWVLEESIEPIPLPSASEKQGAILGDLRSVDDKGIRHVFVIRIRGDKAMPGWLANWALASHSLGNVRVYVVVEESSSLLERSARSCGAGVLAIGEGDPYTLRTVVDPREYDADRRKKELAKRAKELRDNILRKVELNKSAAKQGFAQTSGARDRLNEAQQSEYEEDTEAQIRRWETWGQDMGQRLDEVESSGDSRALEVLEREIERGV